jgi:uncharacterized SAM-binding protein YcdF (DUF218 family)
MMRRSPWTLGIIVAVALAGATLAAVPAARVPLLRAAGWALVAADPLERADVIVIAAYADGEGVLEAAELVKAGFATRVAIFAAVPDAVDREILRRGLPFESGASLATRQLKALGVTAIEEIALASGTHAEAELLPPWCDREGIRSLIFVTTPDHSRRLRRVLQRAMAGRPTKIMVHPARYSTFDPDSWWQSRDSIRTEIVEFQKLVLDVISHPRL